MSLETKDIELLAQLIKGREEQQKSGGDKSVWDLIIRISTPLMVAGITFMISTTNDLSSSQKLQQLQTENLQKSFEKFESFTQAPRFTQSDFDRQTIPMITQLNLNTELLNNRADFINKTKDRLTRLELSIEKLSEP